jgi:hypothetical protein
MTMTMTSTMTAATMMITMMTMMTTTMMITMTAAATDDDDDDDDDDHDGGDDDDADDDNDTVQRNDRVYGNVVDLNLSEKGAQPGASTRHYAFQCHLRGIHTSAKMRQITHDTYKCYTSTKLVNSAIQPLLLSMLPVQI